MIIISHRGNLNGPNSCVENHPDSIDFALSCGVDVEVDIRYLDGKIYLGHDEPQYEIHHQWLIDRCWSLWVHCKNKEALEVRQLNRFYHDKDAAVFTSAGYLWAYPGNQPLKNSIAVLPELHNETSDYGVCTDFPFRYRGR